jgi:hypothetical protein
MVKKTNKNDHQNIERNTKDWATHTPIKNSYKLIVQNTKDWATHTPIKTIYKLMSLEWKHVLLYVVQHLNKI